MIVFHQLIVSQLSLRGIQINRKLSELVMSNNQQSQHSSQITSTEYPSIYTNSRSDEIDLFELIITLWRKKWWIAGCMLITTLLAGIYAFNAKEQWTSTAVLNLPRFESINNYYQGFRLVEGEILNPTSSDAVATKLFQQFIVLASSYNEISDYLKQSEYFKSVSSGLDNQKQARMLEELVKSMTFRKDKTNLFYTVRFSAETAKQAEELLANYIAVVNQKISRSQYAELMSQIDGKKKSIDKSMSSLQSVAEERREDEIEDIKVALFVAEKADIQKSDTAGVLYSNRSNLFLFGKDALEAMLTSIEKKPLALDAKYYRLQGQLIELEIFNIGDENAQAFSYLKNPSEPVTKDKPKRVLILALGILFGAVLGSAIVLLRPAIFSLKQKIVYKN